MTTSSDNKNLVEPPEDLDGAKVIVWAWSGKEPFGYLPFDDGSPPIEIYGLAICQYEGSFDFYRFSCDNNWEVQQDSPHDSIEQAQKQLPDQYKLITAKWNIR
jgi:hypothetical protein